MSFYISQENDVKIIKNNLLTIVLKAIINGIMDILVYWHRFKSNSIL